MIHPVTDFIKSFRTVLTICMIAMVMICAAQSNPEVQVVEINNAMIGNNDWRAETDIKAGEYKSGVVFRIAGYKTYHDSKGVVPWPFEEKIVRIDNNEFRFFDHSELVDVQGHYYAVIRSNDKNVLVKYNVSTGAILQQTLEITEDVIVSCFDRPRNRMILQVNESYVFYAVDLQQMNVIKKITATEFGISKTGRYIVYNDDKITELDPVSFKKSKTLTYGSVDRRELPNLDFVLFGSLPFGSIQFLNSDVLADSYGLNNTVYCEANKTFYDVHFSVDNFNKTGTDTMYYVAKLDLATGVKTRVFESEYKIEYAQFSSDFRTLALIVNKDKPTLNCYERPARTANILAQRQAIANKIYADSMAIVNENAKRLAREEARKIAVEDSIRTSEALQKFYLEEYLRKEAEREAEIEAKRLAEEKRLAEDQAVGKRKYALKTTMRNYPLEKIDASAANFSDRGLGVYAGFECTDKNDETYYYIFDKDLFAVYDTATTTLNVYRYPYTPSDGKRDIRHYYTGHFIMIDHERAHVYIVDAYRGIIKRKYELAHEDISPKYLMIVPGTVGLLFLDPQSHLQAFYSHRKDSLCFESTGRIDISKFYLKELYREKLFPDFTCDLRLARKPDEADLKISSGFTFVYNNDYSRVFSVKKNDFEELEPHEKLRLRGDVRFEGYNGLLFGTGGNESSVTTLIDKDNMPESSKTYRQNGLGFDDNYERNNDLLLIYNKTVSYGHSFYSLNGQIIQSFPGQIDYYRMQHPHLINHGLELENGFRLVVVRDSTDNTWLMRMYHFDVINAHLLKHGQKVVLSSDEKLKLRGEIVLEKEALRYTTGSSRDRRDGNVEEKEEQKTKVEQVEQVDPNKLFEATAKMEGYSDTGMRLELQVRVQYTVKREKDFITGQVRNNRYPQAYDVVTYRLPATGNKWLPCSSEITECGYDTGTDVTAVLCIYIGGVAYKVYGPEYYD